MITIITGTPGAGKTLYAISKLLLPLVGTSIDSGQLDSAGEPVRIERKIYTNIKGLMIDHELIDESATGGLRNWHEWANPGSVIVFDEVQKVWEPRSNGSKVPEDIKALETHRHMGVDFILITQGLMLTERNLAMLCGRHLHVRRVANWAVAIVYEWDHASRTLMYAKAISKSPWRYDKKVFKLYRSAELHTKQKRSTPTLLYFVLAGVVAFAILAPTLKSRMEDRFGKPKVDQAAPGQARAGIGAKVSAASTAELGQKAAALIDDAKDWLPRDPLRPESAPAYDGIRKVAVMPVMVGCVTMGKRARCYTQQGTVVDVHPDMAASLLDRPRFDPYEPQKSREAPLPLQARENVPEGRSGGTLIVMDGPGWRDPQGAQSAAGVRR